MRKFAVASAMLALSVVAHGVDYFGSGFNFVDATINSSGEVINGVATGTITVAGSGLQVGSLNSVTLTNLNHTFVGDIEVELSHVTSGTTVTLTAPPVDAPSNFLGTYTFIVNPALLTIDEVVAGQNDAFNIPSGNYAPSGFGGTGNGPRTNFNAFTGLALDSQWRLTVTDFAQGDTGSLGAWSFNVSAVPEPGTMAALGLGVAALLRRKKRA